MLMRPTTRAGQVCQLHLSLPRAGTCEDVGDSNKLYRFVKLCFSLEIVRRKLESWYSRIGYIDFTDGITFSYGLLVSL